MITYLKISLFWPTNIYTDSTADTRVASRTDDVQGACAVRMYISFKIVLSAWK